jgi:hypothetical protein
MDCIKPTEETSIAYVQYNIVTQWINEVVSDIHRVYSTRTERTKEKQEHQLRIFRRLATKIFSTGLIDPMTTVTGIFLFNKVLNVTENLSFGEFKLFYVTCILLSYKMYEDQNHNSSECYDLLNLESQDIDYDEFIKTERRVLQLLEYNVFVKYEEVEKFILLETLKVAKQVSESVWKRCQNFFKKRIINPINC